MIATDQAFYREFCEQKSPGGLFCAPWWLDASCGPGAWDVVVATGKEGDMRGALPFRRYRRKGLRIIGHPPLTPYLGPWVNSHGGGHYRAISTEFEVLGELLEGLPPHDLYRQTWSTERKLPHPFIWKGFTATVGFTYAIEETSDGQAAWRGLASRARGGVRRAREREGLKTVRVGATELYGMIAHTFARQQLAVPYGVDLIQRLLRAVAERSAGEALGAMSPAGELQAAALFVHDDRRTWYLAGGQDPTKRDSAAMSLLLWEGVQRAGDWGTPFDFEGSMIPGVEWFFRGFGGYPQPILKLTGAATLRGRLAMLARQDL